MNITVVGLGHVGASLAVLLAERHSVVCLDVDAEKVALLASGRPPIAEAAMSEALAGHSLDITATTDAVFAYNHAELIIVAVPTDYDPQTNRFNTSIVEEVVAQVHEVNPGATIVIRSTVPVGFTQELSLRLQQTRLLFSPEFLREGHALDDNLHPSRIVVGVPRLAQDSLQDILQVEAQSFAAMLSQAAQNGEVPVLIMGADEAEASKLFSNTYLACRIAFFNELDTYAFAHGLDTEQIIAAVSLDARIGKGYNNPSFGFGGYCLPKDTKQLLANFEDVPQRLVAAIIESNQTRKDAMVDAIVARVAQEAVDKISAVVGVYRLGMKAHSENMRSSSVLDIVAGLRAHGMTVLVYEPALGQNHGFDFELTSDLESFLERSSVIVANRLSDDIALASHKVFSRDLALDD